MEKTIEVRNGMDVELLREVQQAILKYPSQLRMEEWLSEAVGAERCGTAACIGGWVYTLSKPFGQDFGDSPGKAQAYADKVGAYIEGYAQERLGITWDQSQRLFYTSDWP